MLLQTNSYLVHHARRAEHARLMRRFRACFERLGSEFEVYEQVGPEFAPIHDDQNNATRFVQMMRFRDHEHQRQVNERERNDDVARRLIDDFCRLVDLPAQQRQGQYAGGYYEQTNLEPTPPSPASPSSPAADPNRNSEPSRPEPVAEPVEVSVEPED